MPLPGLLDPSSKGFEMPAHTDPLTIIWGLVEMYLIISKIHLEQSCFVTASDKSTGSIVHLK